jgi:glycosyltransferase involved in cell wall biosynthesis
VPLVSVIVRTIARPELALALASIAAQTYRPLEIIIVDAWAKGLSMQKYGGIPVRTVSGRRLDRAQAANAGLQATCGEWLLFLDEDDQIDPDHLSQLVAAAIESGSEVAYSQTRLVDAAGQTVRIFGGPFNRNLLLQSNYLAIHAVLFSRAVVDAGHRFDETLTVSRTGTSGCSSRGAAISRSPEALRRYTTQGSGQSGASANSIANCYFRSVTS